MEARTGDDAAGFGRAIHSALLEGNVSSDTLVGDHQLSPDGDDAEVRTSRKIKSERLARQFDGLKNGCIGGIHRHLQFIDIESEGERWICGN